MFIAGTTFSSVLDFAGALQAVRFALIDFNGAIVAYA